MSSSNTAPLLPKLGAESEPPASYGSAGASSAGPLTPPDVALMDRRSRHVPSLQTDDESLFCFTTPLAGLLGVACCPLTVCGMPTIIPPRVEAVGVVFGRYVGAQACPFLLACLQHPQSGLGTSCSCGPFPKGLEAALPPCSRVLAFLSLLR